MWKAGTGFTCREASAIRCFSPGTAVYLKNRDFFCSLPPGCSFFFGWRKICFAAGRRQHILAIEYCKAISQLHSPIIPHTISRIGHAHDSDAPIYEGDFPSASQLRAMLRQNRTLPDFYRKKRQKFFWSSRHWGCAVRF